MSVLFNGLFPMLTVNFGSILVSIPAAKMEYSDYLQQLESQEGPVLEYDLDEYGIKSLEGFKFREEVEEISLFGNDIRKPTDITTILMKLPNLKALWLNGNPVQSNCSNFNIIGDHFDKLEIFNS